MSAVIDNLIAQLEELRKTDPAEKEKFRALPPEAQAAAIGELEWLRRVQQIVVEILDLRIEWYRRIVGGPRLEVIEGHNEPSLVGDEMSSIRKDIEGLCGVYSRYENEKDRIWRYWARLPSNPVWPYDGTSLIFDGPLELFLHEHDIKEGECHAEGRTDCRCMKQHGFYACQQCGECGVTRHGERMFCGDFPREGGNFSDDWKDALWSVCEPCIRARRLPWHDVPRERRLAELADQHDLDHVARWIENPEQYRTY